MVRSVGSLVKNAEETRDHGQNTDNSPREVDNCLVSSSCKLLEVLVKGWLRGHATNIICSFGGPQREASVAVVLSRFD